MKAILIILSLLLLLGGCFPYGPYTNHDFDSYDPGPPPPPPPPRACESGANGWDKALGDRFTGRGKNRAGPSHPVRGKAAVEGRSGSQSSPTL